MFMNGFDTLHVFSSNLNVGCGGGRTKNMQLYKLFLLSS